MLPMCSHPDYIKNHRDTKDPCELIARLVREDGISLIARSSRIGETVWLQRSLGHTIQKEG